MDVHLPTTIGPRLPSLHKPTRRQEVSCKPRPKERGAWVFERSGLGVYALEHKRLAAVSAIGCSAGRSIEKWCKSAEVILRRVKRWLGYGLQTNNHLFFLNPNNGSSS
jgi:hypothetical protein